MCISLGLRKNFRKLLDRGNNSRNSSSVNHSNARQSQDFTETTEYKKALSDAKSSIEYSLKEREMHLKINGNIQYNSTGSHIYTDDSNKYQTKHRFLPIHINNGKTIRGAILESQKERSTNLEMSRRIEYSTVIPYNEPLYTHDDTHIKSGEWNTTVNNSNNSLFTKRIREQLSSYGVSFDSQGNIFPQEQLHKLLSGTYTYIKNTPDKNKAYQLRVDLPSPNCVVITARSLPVIRNSIAKDRADTGSLLPCVEKKYTFDSVIPAPKPHEPNMRFS